MGKKHSRIAPSKADRWMNCPGSVVLEEKCPPQPQSEYAAEGSAAHELAATCLTAGGNTDEWIGETLESEKFKFKVTADMAEAVQEYVDTVRRDMTDDGVLVDGVPGKALLVEKDFDLSSIDKTLHGTCDAAYTSPFGRLKAYDLKFGRGVYVEVDDNPQLLIYALGVWNTTDRQADEIELVIVQPRYPGEDHVRRSVYTRNQLLDFELKLKKAVAVVNAGSMVLKTGGWCKFCAAQAVCEAKSKEIFDVIPAPVNNLPEPASLSIEQMVKILKISEVIADWADAIHAHAETLAQSGVPIPGYKLVQKRGNRRWVDEIAVETAFETLYGEDIYEKKLKSPAKLEKVVGKDAIKEYVEVPDNGTQLVPETAKGEAIAANPSQIFNKITKE